MEEHVSDVCCKLVLWQCLMSIDGDGEDKVAALNLEPCDGDKPIKQIP